MSSHIAKLLYQILRKIFAAFEILLWYNSLCDLTWHIFWYFSYCATVVQFRELSNSTEYCWITSIPLVYFTSLISIFNRSTSMNLMQTLPDLPQSLPQYYPLSNLCGMWNILYMVYITNIYINLSFLCRHLQVHHDWNFIFLCIVVTIL